MKTGSIAPLKGATRSRYLFFNACLKSIFLVCLLVLSVVNKSFGQSTDPAWDDQFAAYGVDGEVHAAALDMYGALYVGGEFSRAGGLAADGIALYANGIWKPVGGGLGGGFSGAVLAIAVTPDGSVYIGGDFGEVVQENGDVIEASNLAKWDGSRWEAVGTGVDGAVHTLAVDDSGLLYIGGAFSRDGTGEFELSKIAAWDGSNLSSVGNGLGTFSGVVVRALGFDSQGTLYAGGTELSGGIFRWTGQDWETFGARHEGSIHTMVFDDQDNLYVGGDFQTVTQPNGTGLGASRIAIWDGSVWDNVGNGFGDAVHTLGFDQAGRLHAGGAFTQLGNGAIARQVARWNASWEPVGLGDDENLFEHIRVLVFTGTGGFYALGDVQHLGNVLVNGIGYWDGQEWTGTGNKGMDAAVRALAFDSSGILYAGGSFTYAGAEETNKIARWVNHSWEALGYGITGNSVDVLAAGANRVMYAGGNFESVQQENGTNLVVYNIAMWDNTNWAALGTGFNGTVSAMVINGNGDLFVGGDFTQDGSGQETRNFIAVWDGATWTTPGGGFDAAVHALALDKDGNVVAGGAFSAAGAVANTAYLARWNGTSWEPFSNDTALNGEVNALYLDENDRLYIGGAFTEVESGLDANYIASWENDAWSQLGASGRNGVSTCCVATIGGGIGESITVGGDFVGIVNPVGPDLQVNNVALWMPGLGWESLMAGVDNDVLALASNGEDVMVGGRFQEANGQPSAYIGRWSSNELLVSVEGDVDDLPATLTISGIYPNPALQEARLDFSITDPQHVTIELFDILGRNVGRLIDRQMSANQTYSITLDRGELASGTYFVRISGDSFVETRPIVWIE